MTCKDCCHFDVCIDFKHYWERKRCKFFKDKSKIIELPIKITKKLNEELTKYCYERCIDEL